MTKFYLSSLLATALLAFGGGNVLADDVTSQYITNADFEGESPVYSYPQSDRAIYQPNGWSITYSNGDKNDITILNNDDLSSSTFSGIFKDLDETTFGTKTFRIRYRWGDSECITLSQKVTLPAGNYKLSAYVAGNSNNCLWIYAGNRKSLEDVNDSKWKTISLVFTSDGSEMEIGVKIPRVKDEQLCGIDNFKLESTTESPLTDVTSDYIANPSFESDGKTFSTTNTNITGLTGWTETGMGSSTNNSAIVDAGTSMGDQNFGDKATPSDGTYFFYGRRGWAAGSALTLTTNFTKGLTPGVYYLAVDYKLAHCDNGSGGGSDTELTSTIKSGETTIASVNSPTAIVTAKYDNINGSYFTNAEWRTLTSSFTITESTAASLELKMNIGGVRRSDFLIDNIRLYKDIQKSLDNVITNAKEVNKVLNNSDLSTAISTAESNDATEDAISTLKTAIETAIENDKNNIANGTDVTALFVTNNSFETGLLYPWDANSASDTGVKANSDETYTTTGVDGSYLFNTWNTSTDDKYVKQTLTNLPEGFYTVSALVASDNGNSVNLIAGDTKTSVSASSDGKGTFVTGTTDKVYVADGGSLEIGATSTNWYKVDNFQLTYYTVVKLAEDATKAPAESSDANVYYNRSFKQGWNSIVLPFDATLTELGASEAIEYAGTSNTTINFKTATSLEANKPYMVYFDKAKTDATTFTGKTIADTKDETLTTTDDNGQYNFVGTYVQKTGENSPITSNDYVVVTGGIQKAKGGNTLKAFRAYFAAQAPAAKSLTFTIDGNVVTGVKAVELQNAVNNGAIYNLAGQRVSDSYKGIVIKNGKKYVK